MLDKEIVFEIIRIKKELFIKYHKNDEYLLFLSSAKDFILEMNHYRNMYIEIDKIIDQYEEMMWDALILRAEEICSRKR